MTYLTNVEIKKIIHLAAHQIRIFLNNANGLKFKGDARKSIEDFHLNPGAYEDAALLEKGANLEEAHKFAVRIEMRGVYSEGAAQVVAKGIWGRERTTALNVFRKEISQFASPVEVRMAGSSSFEFNRLGVDKSLPIKYVQNNFDALLNEMGYTPGNMFDARQRRLVIAADGDGTIYDGPKTTHLPTLYDSPVFHPVVQFLKAGGIFMLVSGNDLNRSHKRLMYRMPKELYNRILIAANGGADLAFAAASGKPHFIDHYRHHALELTSSSPASVKSPEIIYLGDDASPDGNDYAAFRTVGKDHAFIVKTLEHTKTIIQLCLHERQIDIAKK